ncbi:hypothetical protein HNQ65_000769 [Prosthecobacter vanneervenii]|uniref:Uncharacterized protein n=1 Tax=Prosthecobacter vanneervenii TaxID=48466 RepID=A0A7W7Y8J4_9BACT|nr:hypothetical protein [Prosthecobacter vanneervenii]
MPCGLARVFGLTLRWWLCFPLTTVSVVRLLTEKRPEAAFPRFMTAMRNFENA